MRIVIADADTMNANYLRFVLAEAGHHETVHARTAEEALAATFAEQTDVVLLDPALSDGHDADLFQALRERGYAGPIIVVTQQRTTQDKVRAFTRGADDFVERPFDPPELVARISAVVRRCRRSESRLASTVLQVGSARLSMSHLTFQIDGQPPVRLTPTEMQLLALLMQSSMSPVSRSRLIERTWGIEFLHESNRVDVYIRRLREKIEPDPSSPIYVRTVRGVGYLFCPPEPGDLPLPGRDASPCSTAASH